MNVRLLLMYVTHISSHTLLRLLLDGAIKLFRLCLPLAGMMELNVSAAFGNCSISKELDEFVPVKSYPGQSVLLGSHLPQHEL